MNFGFGEARDPLRRLALQGIKHASVPTATWRSEWEAQDGSGTRAGILDGEVEDSHPDLADTCVTVRRFLPNVPRTALACAHATSTVRVLAARGSSGCSGIAPGAWVFVASVVGPTGIATGAVALAGLHWLTALDLTLIIIPLGSRSYDPRVAELLESIAARGIPILASAGNTYPDRVLFPAREPFVISVGAIDARGELLFSCCREPRLDLVAPTLPESGTHREQYAWGGSSSACAVAGGMALLAAASSSGDTPRPERALSSAIV